MTGRLTERQARVLEYYLGFVEAHGGQPTIRRAMADLGIKSPNGIISHLKALHQKGWVEYQPDGNHHGRLVRFVGIQFRRVTDSEAAQLQPRNENAVSDI